MGIKRKESKKGERTQKLVRDCKVIFRLCLLRKEVSADSKHGWSTAHWAQIVTDSIKCGKFHKKNIKYKKEVAYLLYSSDTLPQPSNITLCYNIIVQSQGPPAITEMTSNQCSIKGGIVVAAKGKNLESKSGDRPNVKVIFHDKDSNWRAAAHVYHEVTTVSCPSCYMLCLISLIVNVFYLLLRTIFGLSFKSEFGVLCLEKLGIVC